jgi:hypothetical protein
MDGRKLKFRRWGLRKRLPEVMDQEQMLYVCFVAFELNPFEESGREHLAVMTIFSKVGEGSIS